MVRDSRQRLRRLERDLRDAPRERANQALRAAMIVFLQRSPEDAARWTLDNVLLAEVIADCSVRSGFDNVEALMLDILLGVMS